MQVYDVRDLNEVLPEVTLELSRDVVIDMALSPDETILAISYEDRSMQFAGVEPGS